jgi:hypothetical protein
MPAFGHSLMRGETFKMSSSCHISTTFGKSSMQGHSFKFNTFNHATNTSSQSSMQNQRFNHQSTRPMGTISSPSSMPCPQRVTKSTRQGTPNLQQSLGWFVTSMYVGQRLIMEVEIKDFLYHIAWMAKGLKQSCFAGFHDPTIHYNVTIWKWDFSIVIQPHVSRPFTRVLH